MAAPLPVSDPIEGELAPVLIGTYTRLGHLRQTVAALAANPLAAQTRLFICSDAPRPGDEAAVAAVREFLRTIEGFREVRIIERRHNGRVANVRGGYKMLLREFGRAIFLEDDIVTAPGFLAFMNGALQTYADRDDVLAVSGYTPPIAVPADYRGDAIALPRYIGWGMGCWAHKFDRFGPISNGDFDRLLASPELLQRLDTELGADLLRRFRAEANGHLDSIDTRASFYALVHGGQCVVPRQSLVRNVGHDGSGLHSAKTAKFDVVTWQKSSGFRLDEDLAIDPRIATAQRDFFASSESAMAGEVIDDLIQQITARGWREFSLWGVDVMTDLFLQRVRDDFAIRYFIDSWATGDMRYRGRAVVTPQAAVAAGETRIVIMSFASRGSMQEQMQAIAPGCELIAYQERSA